MLLCQISNAPSLLLLFRVCISLHSFSKFLLHAISMRYTSSSCYLHSLFPHIYQPFTITFPIITRCDIRYNIFQCICAMQDFPIHMCNIRCNIFKCRYAHVYFRCTVWYFTMYMCDVIFSNAEVQWKNLQFKM